MKTLVFVAVLLLPALSNAEVVPTSEWVSFWSDGSIAGFGPMPAGAMVRAYDPDGIQCGEFEVTFPGAYGLMPVYRDDWTTPDVDEGADPGDPISFTVDGVPAEPIGPDAPVWSSNGDVKKVDLLAGEIFSLDIYPGSCPNPLNIKWFEKLDSGNENENAKLKKGGVVPVAVAGNAVYDVADIDVTTLLLEGVPPLRHSYEDVTRPVDGERCDCTTDGADGIMDLTLKFSKRAIVEVLGPLVPGETKTLTLAGRLLDGMPFESTDCVRIIGNVTDLREPPQSNGDDGILGPPIPNPFNPTTRITYALPEEEFVRLSVYDISGRLVERLVARVQPAGQYVIEWDAQGMPSGMYFCRIDTADRSETRKLILLK